MFKQKLCTGFTRTGKKCQKKIKIHEKLCNIHKKNFIQEKPENCIICLSNLNNQKKSLKCGHWIHKKCIVDSAKDECPICRKPICLGIRDKNRLNKLAKKYQHEQLLQEIEELRDEEISFIDLLVTPEIQDRVDNFIIENNYTDDDIIDNNELMHYIFQDTNIYNDFITNFLQIQLINST